MDDLKQKYLSQIADAADENVLEDIRLAAVGKKGEVALKMRELGKMTPEERQVAGPALNALKDEINSALAAKKAALADAALDEFMEDQDAAFPIVYISFPSAKDPDYENRHPGTATIEVVAPAPYEWFEKWNDATWGKRGDDYDQISDFQNNVDAIAIAGRFADNVADALDQARIVKGDAVFDFGGGHTLTIEDVGRLGLLSNDIDIL